MLMKPSKNDAQATPLFFQIIKTIDRQHTDDDSIKHSKQEILQAVDRSEKQITETIRMKRQETVIYIAHSFAASARSFSDEIMPLNSSLLVSRDHFVRIQGRGFPASAKKLEDVNTTASDTATNNSLAFIQRISPFDFSTCLSALFIVKNGIFQPLNLIIILGCI